MWSFFKKKIKNEQLKIESDIYISEDVKDLIIRKPNEVAERILALFAVISKVHQNNNESFWLWYKVNQIEKFLSHQEVNFINDENPSEEDLITFSWRAEALVSLLWSAKVLKEMPPLNSEFDIYSIENISKLIKDSTYFIKNIELRSKSELQKMEYELFDSHWRVRDARLFNKEMPIDLNPSIVYERRYAMSWIIGFGENWDDVPTDT